MKSLSTFASANAPAASPVQSEALDGASLSVFVGRNYSLMKFKRIAEGWRFWLLGVGVILAHGFTKGWDALTLCALGLFALRHPTVG
jgi:hypothetical protein